MSSQAISQETRDKIENDSRFKRLSQAWKRYDIKVNLRESQEGRVKSVQFEMITTGDLEFEQSNAIRQDFTDLTEAYSVSVKELESLLVG